MRWSRPATTGLSAAISAAAISAAVCLGAAACGTTAPVAGAAYGTTQAAPPATGGTASAAAAGKTLLTVRKTAVGYVLATWTGHTIYWYSTDVKGSGKSACTGSCLAAWPAVTGSPAAAPGVRLAGKLGTITRPGGVVQATYNGYPLYTYAQDVSPGQVLGNGSGGVWHVITGAVLSPSPAAAAAASLRDAPASDGVTASPSATATGYGYGGGGY